MTHEPQVRNEPGSALRPARVEIDDARWLDVVNRHPDATAFHLPAWGRAIARCYGFPLFVLALVDHRGSVTGGVPVVEVKHPFRRPRWVTLPFTDHCPPLGWEREADTAALVRELGAELTTRGVASLEVRADVPGTHSTPVAVRHLLDLDDDPDRTFARFHRSQVQRNVRRSERAGVTVRLAERETDLTETFYRLHRLTRQRQGVPVQPRRFFELIWQHVIAPGHGSVLVAEHGGTSIAAAVFLHHNRTVIYKFGASDSAAWDVRPNHAIFSHAIRAAIQDGHTRFDWGRTDLENAGLRAFKASWAARELPLHHSLIHSGTASPLPELQRQHGAGTDLVGAVIRRSPPWVCSALGTALYRFTA